MKLEWPMLTSTLPRELSRPIMVRFSRIRYSNPRASRRAIAALVLTFPPAARSFAQLGGWFAPVPEGLAGADRSESRTQASEESWLGSLITRQLLWGGEVQGRLGVYVCMCRRWKGLEQIED